MKTIDFRWLAVALLVLTLAFTTGSSQQPPAVESQALIMKKPKGSGFPDFGFMVSPSEYAAKYSDEPVFRLKADFPSQLPNDLPKFLAKIDFRTQPLAYIEAVRDYAFEGNLPNWDPWQNHVREWYHIPWLHPTSIGPNAYPPNGGTVFAKLLFTDAPQGRDHIPFLENPLQWTAYITPTFFPTGSQPVQRVVGKVNLLQMDIAVRDARADAPGLTGWVFGTFVYNGRLNKPNKFMNLVPLGLMWGNDPENRINKTDPFPPVHTRVNKDLLQSVIFDTPELPPQHLG